MYNGGWGMVNMLQKMLEGVGGGGGSAQTNVGER
jgi:hypothetical protein